MGRPKKNPFVQESQDQVKAMLNGTAGPQVVNPSELLETQFVEPSLQIKPIYTPNPQTTTQTKPQFDQSAPTFETQGFELFKKKAMKQMGFKYKFTVGMMKLNVGIDSPDHEPLYVDTEHCHYLTTIDSNGRKVNITNTVGGHFHIVEVKEFTNGNAPFVKIISGPMKWARKTTRSQTGKKMHKTIMVPANDLDTHTHQLEAYLGHYEQSSRTNAEAVQVQNFYAAKLQAPDQKEYIRKLEKEAQDL